jgi:hypothetical protein
MTPENLAKFKEMQKQSWSFFAPLEIGTTMPAAELVKFSQVGGKDTILDGWHCCVSPPPLWGNPSFVQEQLSDAVQDLIFDQGLMRFPALSVNHYREMMERTVGPLIKLVQDCQNDPQRLQQFRDELKSLATQYYAD